MGPLENGGRSVIYLEGSIARNPAIKPGFFEEIRRKMKSGLTILTERRSAPFWQRIRRLKSLSPARLQRLI